MMSSEVLWSRSAVKSLCEMVEEQCCLWDPKDADYLKRKVRAKVFEDIAIKIKTQYPLMSCLTGDEVRAKFKKLKSYFMRELKKIQSAPSGSAGKVSGKWEFYDCLVFLTAGCEELMSVSESSWHRPTQHQQLETAEELREAGESGPNDCHPVLNLESNTTELIPDLDIVKEEVEEEVTPVKKKARLSEGMSSEQVLPMRGDTLSCIRQEDEWNTYGRTVANSLRKLPCHVQPYAQKLISDVIFYAQIGQLNLNSKIVTK